MKVKVSKKGTKQLLILRNLIREVGYVHSIIVDIFQFQ